jgi:hypothetical protein
MKMDLMFCSYAMRYAIFHHIEMGEPILSVKGISKRFGGLVAIEVYPA